MVKSAKLLLLHHLIYLYFAEFYKILLKYDMKYYCLLYLPIGHLHTIEHLSMDICLLIQ